MGPYMATVGALPSSGALAHVASPPHRRYGGRRPMSLPVSPPVAPMLARLARELPEGGWVYEPKWDGFRALAFRDGDDVDVRSRHDRRFARYFPEVVDAVRALPARRCVLDGELLVVRGRALDFGAHMARLHPARSRAE